MKVSLKHHRELTLMIVPIPETADNEGVNQTSGERKYEKGI